MAITRREEDDKCPNFSFFNSAGLYTGSLANLNNHTYDYFGRYVTIIRITDGSPGTLHSYCWPGQIICIENQLESQCSFNWTVVKYPEKTSTGGNLIATNTEILFPNWWSAWISTDEGMTIMMASL